MPLPLGHSAVGIAAYSLTDRNVSSLHRLKIIVFVCFLSNLPDIDVLIGLLWQGNGNAYHRGPTHSLIFVLIFGFLAANAWRIWSKIPKLGFGSCSLFILSHILADFFLSGSPISFLWPLETNWSLGHSGWSDVIGAVFLESPQDTVLICICAAIIILSRMRKEYFQRSTSSSFQHFFKSMRIF